MELHIVDMIIVGLILFLAIRGLVNGFSKELFNFLALIGGIAVAARSHSVVGEFITQQNLLPNLSADFQKLVGFAVVLILILILFKIISSVQSHVQSEAPQFFSRLLGYLISVARYIAIFSLIIFGINNADFLREKLAKHYEGNHLFSPMVSIGAKLLNANQGETENRKDDATQENNETNSSESNLSEENLSMDISNITLTEHNVSE
jgi:membrane protein required for colicin V production